ncbi:HAMP domain-containing histidine kinase [Methylobacillus gramineus]|uniref:sensor histidine kinase n=1 Tax=Methylobacillus gramineus TaxID=755169 RepID=UPI001CFFD6BB|nr:HAMP domain-containing sensor histidine kinase [Methylobacillus gramineus]MCB5185908.1 HAMP domain-containing histidine kinase [Methylobacillus gramineus]
MPRKALPIRHILLSAFLLAVLLPTILITGLAFYEARTVLKNEIQNGMQNQVSATAQEIDRMMFERLQNIASWSELDVMQDVRIGDIDKRLSSFLAELKDSYADIYTELYVVNPKGIIVASSHPAHLGKFAPRLHPWLHTLIRHQVMHIATLNQDQLPIYSDIQDDLNETKSAGTLVAVFNWHQVELILQSAVAGRSAAALFDKNNAILAATSRWDKIQASRKLVASAKTAGYQGYHGFSWQVKIAQSRSQALTPVRHMSYIFFGLLIATVLLATLIAIPVARSITRPLASLTEFANRFIRIPNEAAPPTGGPEEINAMSEAFAKMISDLDRSKQSLTRAAKLAVAGEMAAAMSHEVRTPLGILRSSAQILLREPSLTQEGREVCGFIISETERLNKLVSTLVDSSKPRLPELQATDLTGLAQLCISMLRSQAAKKQITLTLADSPAVMCACDSEQMTQVILNLLLNALQILPEAGHITLAVSQTTEHACISIADNGPGIAPEYREQIFDPFFSQRHGGIGLGLAVVRQIIVAHHGEISVRQSDMNGAEFVLQIPLNGV